MSEKEKQVVEKLRDAIPKMSDFDKGYILGKVESMAECLSLIHISEPTRP